MAPALSMADLGVINALSFGHWQVSIGSCCGRKARGGMLRHAPSAGYRGVDRGNQAPQVYPGGWVAASVTQHAVSWASVAHLQGKHLRAQDAGRMVSITDRKSVV